MPYKIAINKVIMHQTIFSKVLKFCFRTKNIVVHGWLGGKAFLRTADHKLFFISCNEVVEEEAF